MSDTSTKRPINRRVFGAHFIVGAAAGPSLLVACGGGESDESDIHSREGSEGRTFARAAPTATSGGTVKKWQPNDLVFTSTNSPADTITTRLSARFTGPGNVVITVPGFFSAANTWTVRFSATREGTWTYETTSSDAQLNGKTGTLTCVANTDANVRGFIQIDTASPYHFVWENGARHFKLGYEVDWLGQMTQDGTAANQAAVDQLLNMLVANGFTDVLLSSYTDVTPSSWIGQRSPLTGGPYDFGPTDQMPWLGAKSSPQFKTVNPGYWRNFDYAVDALFKRGLIAHMYLKAQSNKYVSGGMVSRGSADEQAYIRYVVARYQAYPNVIFDYQKEANGVSQSAHLAALDIIESADGYTSRLRTAHDADEIVDKVSALPRYDFRTDQFHPGGNPDGGDTSYVNFSQYAAVLYQRDNMKPGGWPVYIAESNYQQPNSGTGNFSNGSSPENMIDRALEHVMAGGYYAYYYELHAWDLIKFDEVPNGLPTFGNLARFMATTKWYQLTPNDSIIGGGSSGKHALANAGKEYIVLAGRSQSSVVLSVSGVATSASLSGRWLNLQTGEASAVSNVGNGNASFNKPWSGVPAMLHLTTSSTSTNQAPVVNAGNDASTPDLQYELQGKVEDSTLPAGSSVTSSWSVVSGPGTVSFGDVAAAVTRATFSAGGAYVLELKATDGELSAADTVQIKVGTQPTGGGDGLKGEYFANKTLTGAPVLTRIDPTVDFSWGLASPAAAVPADNFSARWTGFITAPVSGVYTLYVNSNDGNRLWIGGTQLTNRWKDGIAEDTATVTLVAGQRYAITLEVYEGVKTALARLSWAYPGQAKQVIPQASLSSQ
jgi:PA14 domain/Domain of unknown function (DUF5060)/Protein of unknown function (DUF4038)